MLDINFEKALRQADAVEEIANGYLEQSKRLELMASELPLIWNGETATAYKAKLETFIALLQQNAKEFFMIAADYRDQVQRLSEIETENAEMLRRFSDADSRRDMLTQALISGE